MEVTFKLIDATLAAEVDAKAAETMGAKDGARFVVRRSAKGVELVPVKLARDMALIDEIMEEDYDVLRRLAQ